MRHVVEVEPEVLVGAGLFGQVVEKRIVEELFGVAALQGVLNPRAVGFKSDEIARTISLPPDLT